METEAVLPEGQRMAAETHHQPIPRVAGVPVLGNLFDVDAQTPVQSTIRLARQYGPIFQLDLLGRPLVVVSRPDLVAELCDQTRFDKLIWSPLRNLRALGGDGLFTAWTEEPNWHKAHTILLPTFSQQAMKGYLPAMVDIAGQMLAKWGRLNPDDDIDVSADMTRLTLDTIGLCGFGYRFNSFYREEPHPFIVSMIRALGESLEQLHRLPVQNTLMVRQRRQFQDDLSTMNALVDTLIARRRTASSDANAPQDLLAHMLTGVDKETGERLDDRNIRYQVITFLIAGHETTSGLLSFATYFLLKHPDVLARAYDEVDRVLGADTRVAPTYQQVSQLHYLTQVLNESLRLWPTAPAFALSPYEPTVLGGTYAVDKRHELMVLTPMLHRSRGIWGEDAEEFNPEHFSPDAEQARPPHAFKPFGNGQRACIGRQFAMQEATLVLGMLLQRFELVDHSNYELRIKETLTLKPEGFHIRMRPRTQRPGVVPGPELRDAAEQAREAPAQHMVLAAKHHTPLLVLYGSNLGTAEGLARQVAEDGTDRGFATTLAPLDDYAGRLPTAGAIVLVSASYNGTPPDNAAAFCRWLTGDALPADALTGVSYTVFGCGDHDWAATYQAIPILLDRTLEAHGARRVYQRGEGDARNDFDDLFRAWYTGLWSGLAEALGISGATAEASTRGHRYEVELVPAAAERPAGTEYGAVPLVVLENRELHTKSGPTPSERSTRHLALALPESLTYRAGDHLGILPRNSGALVRRVAARFNFAEDATIRIRTNTTSRTPLPIDQSIPVYALLASYVELQETATRAQIAVLAAYTECPPEQTALLALCGDDGASVARYRDDVLAQHVSLLDLLERFPSVLLPFNIYLELVPPLRPRSYSISSSPLLDPHTATITVAVVAGLARSGRGEYAGVCSSYLASLEPGAVVYGFVRGDPNTPFRLPDDGAMPLIMVGAGTGLAPFRGFLQERDLRRQQGERIGPSLLFYGFRHPQQDCLYADELRGFAARDVTRVVPACSRLAGQPKTYVQDALRAEAAAVWELLECGAIVYVCGDATRMAPAVSRAFADVYAERTGCGEADAGAWLAELVATHRYVVDIWPAQ